ncbi:hypothetical protein QOM21_35895 [Streptomyces sp. Pv4-95]|uniref:hypothetical protein n=1 Tax=Streptomyces sp. Pv4-95 TaxID=3049543 RepID=UPI003891CAFA
MDVKQDLARSGLVVRDVGEEPDRRTAPGGLEVEVDGTDDMFSGLWLTWELHPTVRSTLREAVRAGRPQESIVQASVDVHEQAANAVVCMLVALGYEAERNDESHRPFAVKVLAGPS